MRRYCGMDDVNEIAIVYYSKDGNTRAGAKMLSEELNCRLIELKEKKKGNFIQALFKKGSLLLDNPWDEVTHAKHVYLLFPIWAGNGAPAMNTFIERADLDSKQVSIITFQQFEDFRNSDKVHKYITDIIISKGGLVKDVFIDSAGAIVGIGLYRVISRIKNRP